MAARARYTHSYLSLHALVRLSTRLRPSLYNISTSLYTHLRLGRARSLHAFVRLFTRTSTSLYTHSYVSLQTPGPWPLARSPPPHQRAPAHRCASAYVSIRQHTSACVSIRARLLLTKERQHIAARRNERCEHFTTHFTTQFSTQFTTQFTT